MGLKFANFAEARVTSAPVGAGGLSFSVASGKGVLFPVLTAGDYFYGVFTDAARTAFEVVKVVGRTGDAMTIDPAGRGIDNSSAAVWTSSDYFYAATPKIVMDELAKYADLASTVSGKGAALVSLEDAGGFFDLTTVEGALIEAVRAFEVATGTANALAVDPPAKIVNGTLFGVRAAAAATVVAPTLDVAGGGAKTITRAGGQPLLVGDIPRAGYEMLLRYNSVSNKYELLNPARWDAADVSHKHPGVDAVTMDLQTILLERVNFARFGFGETKTMAQNVTAWSKAIAQGGIGRLEFSPGDFPVGDFEPLDDCIIIEGASAQGQSPLSSLGAVGKYTTKLSYGGSTVCIDIKGSGTEGKAGIHISDLMVADATGAATIAGIRIGSGVNLDQCSIKRCCVRDFSKKDACGIRVGNVLNSVIEQNLLRNNFYGMIVGGTGYAPTTLTFHRNRCYGSVSHGMVIRGLSGSKLAHSIYESNHGYGLVFNEQTEINNLDIEFYGEDNARGYPITGAANNGAGLVRLTILGHPFTTGEGVYIGGVAGTIEVNTTISGWNVTVIDADHVDLVGSTFVNAFSNVISSITRVGGTATATTAVAHKLVTGDTRLITGALQSQYNGGKTVTVTGPTTFTFPVTVDGADPVSPATGSPKIEGRIGYANAVIGSFFGGTAEGAFDVRFWGGSLTDNVSDNPLTDFVRCFYLGRGSAFVFNMMGLPTLASGFMEVGTLFTDSRLVIRGPGGSVPESNIKANHANGVIVGAPKALYVRTLAADESDVVLPYQNGVYLVRDLTAGKTAIVSLNGSANTLSVLNVDTVGGFLGTAWSTGSNKIHFYSSGGTYRIGNGFAGVPHSIRAEAFMQGHVEI